MANFQLDSSVSQSPNWLLPAAVMAGITFVVTDVSASDTRNYIHQTNKNTEISSKNTWESNGTSDNTVPVYLEGWSNTSSYADWYAEVHERVDALSLKEDGWKGADSFAASDKAYYFTLKFLTKLAQERIDRVPAIGLDYEGTYSLSWSDENIAVDITIYEDGSYSYYASDGNHSVTVDDASLTDTLHGKLISILLS